MERNENGYSLYNSSRIETPKNANGSRELIKDELPNAYPVPTGSLGRERLAMAYVPMQCWRLLYSPDAALLRGTMFEELDLPLEDCGNG